MALLQTNVESGRVNVGDTKTIKVVAEDASGTKLPDPDVEVTTTSPSGSEATYTNKDMSEAERVYYLDLSFEEPGFWHVHIELSSAGSAEVQTGYVRAVATAPEQMDLLTREVWHEYLSEEAMAVGPERLQKLISAAEEKVVERYRETTPRTDNLILEEYYDSDIRLHGWVEDDNDDPDLQAMDEDLLDALRRVIARLVDHEVTSPDSHILRIDQGERRVDYKPDAGELPSGIYLPLTDFDERRRFFFF
ncbi:hypothetical protein GGP85_002907 [Salinibacter ruber]|uniref:FixH family protein n=1 Tax=Salinibacter ruber TaxID=146919 RepID=UPI00216A4DE1|nr:FixH family protein [Salinibacter ruber]MCS3827437.1 hypothetical protein [Salinibacter ruber]